MPDKQVASAADLVRNFGLWQEKALKAPVYITHHKRDRLVLCSVERFRANAAAAQAPSRPQPLDPLDQTGLSELTAEHWALLDNMSESYVVIGENLKILAANRYAETFFTVGRNQLVGRKIDDVFPPRKLLIIKEYISRAIRTRETVSFDLEASDTPGPYARTRLYPHPRGVVMIVQNLTELHHLGKLVNECDALRAAIQRHPDIGHAQTDARGRFTYSDDTMRLWTGFSEEELLSVRLSDIVIVSDRQRLNTALEDVMASQVPADALFHVMVKNFSEREVRLAIAPIISGQIAIGASIVATMAVAA